jgi:hypothetical protein
MAAANSNIQVTNLDFVSIKQNFINFLKSQDTFKDYNFAGSAMSTLLDVLSYNTQYNAYYLNMVANEMFMDTALQRSSVVSHAKLLNYIPKSATAPTATVNLVVNGINDQHSITLPRFSNFLSEAISGKTYPFVTIDSTTVSVVANTATFSNIEIKQGVPVSLTFNYSATSNPANTFVLPDSTIDTSTILVEVYPSPSSNAFSIFNQATSFLGLDYTSPVYFIEEQISGYYQITFGNGIIGKALTDGSVISVSYLTTSGTAATGANNFVLTSSIGSYLIATNAVTSATGGKAQESIDSIKYQAPKQYATQGRAVTMDDYITLIQQNSLGYSFDAVNVWGGQDNDPPAYGQVFVAIKPAGAYTLTDTQKQLLLNNVIKPISVMTVTPTIVDPDYTYIKINVNVLYNSKLTNLTSSQIQQAVSNAIQNFAKSTLNTFNSTFSQSDLTFEIQNADPSIITNEVTIQLQKKFYPILTTPTTISLYYNVPLNKGILTSGISSAPAMQFVNSSNVSEIIDGVFVEEVPSSTNGVESISVINPGFSYQHTPIVKILGDGSGATAEATIINGTISAITVTNSGNNYTQAVVTITPASNDTTGRNGAAIVTLKGQYGNLRTYYYDSNNVKTILNPNIGTVDYVNGIVTLTSFNPYEIDNPLGQLAVSVNPKTSIISSTYNRIITVDPYDPTAITVNVTAQS